MSEVWGEISQTAGAAERLAELLGGRAGDQGARRIRSRCRAAARRGRVRGRALCLSEPAGDLGARRRVASASRRARRSRSSARRAPARARSFICCCAIYDPAVRRGLARRRAALRDADPRERALAHRAGAAGRRDVRRERRRQHPLRPRRTRATPRSRAPPSWRRRPNSSPAAAPVRDADRRARRHAVGRPAPAHRDRARDPARRAAPAARRGDLVARRGKRDAGAGGARAADAGAHDPGDRASAGDRAVAATASW